jgi:hypothetical protein
MVNGVVNATGQDVAFLPTPSGLPLPGSAWLMLSGVVGVTHVLLTSASNYLKHSRAVTEKAYLLRGVLVSASADTSRSLARSALFRRQIESQGRTVAKSQSRKLQGGV